ncbi:COQ9 family protein [Tsuneonella sp. HG249]
MAIAAADLTLDELRLALAPAIADAAVFDGWSDDALVSASRLEGVDADVARLAFPGGAMDMIAAWIASIDAAMEQALSREALAVMKVRERITALVQARLFAIAGRDEALRRALAIMAMPQNLARTARLGWASADRMWRAAGDTATDYNHYTKRAILASLYAATLAVYVDDESEGKADAHAFLDRRIENVMQFEKAKAQILRPDAERFSVSRFLGRLRYPSR